MGHISSSLNNDTLPIKLFWITDRKYLLLTYLSVSSFIEREKQFSFQINIVIEGNISQRLIETFHRLDTNIQIVSASNIFPSNKRNAIVFNRILRTEIVKQYSSQSIIGLIDSDTLFFDSISQEVLPFIKSKDSKIAGVIELTKASSSQIYLYSQETGKQREFRIFSEVFGPNWRKLLDSFQFNNGFLLFKNAYLLADQWAKLYLRGIKNKLVNPIDDQLPLAAAIQKLQIPSHPLPPVLNSLGKLDGNYLIFHALAKRWRDELRVNILLKKHNTKYGKFTLHLLKRTPTILVRDYLAQDKSFKDEPILFNKISHVFNLRHLYEYLARDNRDILEIGNSNRGKSLIFLSELIKFRGSSQKLYSILSNRPKDAATIRSQIRKIYPQNNISYLKRLNSAELQSVGIVFVDIKSYSNKEIRLIKEIVLLKAKSHFKVLIQKSKDIHIPNKIIAPFRNNRFLIDETKDYIFIAKND